MWLVDATGKTVGRIATEIAKVLRGKNKPQFTPHCDAGDFVIVVNAEKVKLTGTKWEDRKHYRHSRYFGSLKELSSAQLMEKSRPKSFAKPSRHAPEDQTRGPTDFEIENLRRAEHPHTAQRPEALNI